MNRTPTPSALKPSIQPEDSSSEQTDIFLSSKQVRKRYGDRSDMWLWRLLRNDPAFPKPLLINGRRYFARTRLEAWERERSADRSRGVE